MYWSCLNERCSGNTPIARLLIPSKTRTLTLDIQEMLTENSVRTSDLYFHEDVDLSFSQSKGRYKVKFEFRTFRDVRLLGTKHETANLVIEDISFPDIADTELSSSAG